MKITIAACALLAGLGGGFTLGVQVDQLATKANQPAQVSCPSEDSCKAKTDYNNGQWHLIVTPDRP